MRPTLIPALAAAALALPACSVDVRTGDGRDGAGPATEAASRATEPSSPTEAVPPVTDSPPPATEPVTPPRKETCDDVTVTPNSGDGLFDVEATGIPCSDAEALIEGWARGGYSPRSGPPGYECERIERYPAGNARLSCAGPQGAIEFDTGL